MSFYTVLHICCKCSDFFQIQPINTPQNKSIQDNNQVFKKRKT